MTDLRVTADANVLASGSIRHRLDAAPVRFVESWRRGNFSLVLSDAILAEVARTLAGPYFTQRLSVDDRAAYHQLLLSRAAITPITSPVSGIASHPEDDLILATALSGGANFLVTGDYKLLELREYQGLLLVTAREFLAILPGFSRAEKI